MVYTAASRALAALEMLVNADWQELTAKRYVVLPAAVPDGLVAQVEALYGLPPEWTATPPPAVLPALGARWLHEAPTPVLSVPSAVLPAERNFLLNPAHARFAEIRTGPAEPFAFDPRLVPATGVPPPRT
jgi:RES domain-containing protein